VYVVLSETEKHIVIQLTEETQPSTSASLLSDGTRPRGGPVSASRATDGTQPSVTAYCRDLRKRTLFKGLSTKPTH